MYKPRGGGPKDHKWNFFRRNDWADAKDRANDSEPLLVQLLSVGSSMRTGTGGSEARDTYRASNFAARATCASSRCTSPAFILRSYAAVTGPVRMDRRATQCFAVIFFITAFIMVLMGFQQSDMVRKIAVWVSNEFVLETEVSETSVS